MSNINAMIDQIITDRDATSSAESQVYVLLCREMCGYAETTDDNLSILGVFTHREAASKQAFRLNVEHLLSGDHSGRIKCKSSTLENSITALLESTDSWISKLEGLNALASKYCGLEGYCLFAETFEPHMNSNWCWVQMNYVHTSSDNKAKLDAVWLQSLIPRSSGNKRSWAEGHFEPSSPESSAPASKRAAPRSAASF